MKIYLQIYLSSGWCGLESPELQKQCHTPVLGRAGDKRFIIWGHQHHPCLREGAKFTLLGSVGSGIQYIEQSSVMLEGAHPCPNPNPNN